MNKRQSDLLKTLYNNRGYLTISELADKFNVSVKTVRNDITTIRDYLENQHSGTLETKPHVGVRIVRDNYFIYKTPQPSRLWGYFYLSCHKFATNQAMLYIM